MIDGYQLSAHQIRACRAVNRLISQNAITDEDYTREAAFDGGEWSGPALDDYQQEIEDTAIRLVGQRFDLNHIILATAVMYYDGMESTFEMESRLKGRLT